mgnify:CR=1 FL=1
MEKSEVMDILVRHMSDNNTSQAICLAYREAGLSIINQLCSGDLSDEFLSKLHLIHETRATYLVFKSQKNGRVKHFRNDIQHFIAFHAQIRDILDFLYKNYDRLNFEIVREIFPKEKLLRVLTSVEQNQEKYINQMQEEELEGILTQIEILEGFFDLAYFSILGEVKYHQFLAEFNKVQSFLREFQNDIVIC